MTSGKIQFSFGALSFSGEGNESWLEKQLDKIIKAAPDLAKLEPPHVKDTEAGESSSRESRGSDSSGKFQTPLATHIREKSAESNQTKRFLAAADWLRRRGTTTLTTASVSKALQDNQQKRLSNPADCLNKNVAKGHCEKTSGGFFITPEGLRELGYK
jgi:hypothetical protein